MKLLLKGGQVFDGERTRAKTTDILISEGRIAAIDSNLAGGVQGTADVILVDVSGKWVFPGFIDLHVHLREPGQEQKETIATGTRAAVRGGFTAVACMANTSPPIDNPAAVSYVCQRAAAAGAARVYPVAAATRGLRGEELTDMAALKAAGAVAVSDDGRTIMNAAVMRRVLLYAGQWGLPVIAHCEDHNLTAGGVMNEGYWATIMGLRGMPAVAEEVIVARDIMLAAATGCPLHITHVSTAGAVELIRRAKEKGLPVTADATPHHLALTEEAVVGYNTNAKVNPPLRTAEDVAALRQALRDGTIDAIATDHAPHAADEKEVEFDLAPFGMVGLETAVGVIITELVKPGLLKPYQLANLFSRNPARILGVAGGGLKPGEVADITVIDPQVEWIVKPEEFASKGRNTPFTGRKLTGRAVLTIVGGQIAHIDGLAVLAPPVQGRLPEA